MIVAISTSPAVGSPIRKALEDHACTYRVDVVRHPESKWAANVVRADSAKLTASDLETLVICLGFHASRVAL